MTRDYCEGDGAVATLKLHLQGCYVLVYIAEVGQPWRAEDDVDISANV